MPGTNVNENIEGPSSAKGCANESMQRIAAEQWAPGTCARAGSGSKAADTAQGQSEKSAKDAKALGLPDTKIFDLENPSPDHWKYDAKGHVLASGNRLSAKYDAKGNLQKATIDGDTFERKGNDVELSFKDRDGIKQTDVMHNVTKFDLTTRDLNSDGQYKSATVDVRYGASSEAGLSAPIWQSPQHQDNMEKLGPH